MKWIFFSLALAGVCCAIPCDAASKKRTRTRSEKSSGAVREITSREQFDEALGSGKSVVIKFYADWCPHCTEFAPKFEAAAVRNSDATFLAGNVDTKAMDKLSDEFGVEELPGVIFLKADGTIVAQHSGVLSDDEIDHSVSMAITKMKPTEQPVVAPEPAPQEMIIVGEEGPMPTGDSATKPAKVAEPTSSGSVPELSSRAEYDEIVKNNPMVVGKLSAEWCGPCQMMKEPFEKVAAQYAGKAKFVEINIDNPDFKQLAMEHASSGIPTMIFVKNGEVIDATTGGKPEKLIVKFVEKHINGGGMREEKKVTRTTTMVRGKPVMK